MPDHGLLTDFVTVLLAMIGGGGAREVWERERLKIELGGP